MAGMGALEIDPAESDEFAEQLLSTHGARSRLEADDYLPEGTSGTLGW